MSIPFRIPWFRLVTGATALAAVLALLSAALGDSPSELPDPLPIRREPISRERADEVLADKGVLVKLPLEGFEGLVRRAALAVEAGRNPPRLAEAHYRARLGDTHLENGSAQWKVINPFPTTGVLSLEPCSLALHKPRFENRDALLAAFDGKTLGLLIGPEREHAVSVDWSARGSRRPDGIHFKLEVPPCPLASLELDLPEHQAVVLTSEGCLVSGPRAAESKDRRLWKVGLTNRSEVQFIVRRVEGDAAGQPSLVFVRQPHNEQRLTPDAVKADYQLNLEVEPRDRAPLAGQRELRLECDPALRVERVTGRNVLQWEFHDLKKANTPNQLVVWVSEPFQGGTLEVHGQAPLRQALDQSRRTVGRRRAARRDVGAASAPRRAAGRLAAGQLPPGQRRDATRRDAGIDPDRRRPRCRWDRAPAQRPGADPRCRDARPAAGLVARRSEPVVADRLGLL
jgi:hypothetical protein